MPTSRRPSTRARLAALVLAAALTPAAADAQRAPTARPGRLSVDVALYGAPRLPRALRDDAACGGSGSAVGAALGVGYRLVGPMRAEARLGGFEQPSAFTGSDCVTGAAGAPIAPRPAGTVERSSGFDPLLADRRAFTQGRLVADVGGARGALRASVGAGTLLRIRAPFVSAGAGFGGRVGGVRVLLEAEQWWLRAPTVDRTVTWQAQPAPAGSPPAQGSTRPVESAERRGSRDVGATWLRLGATVPLPGT